MTQTTKTKRYALWTVQVLLALLFLFAGAMKLTMPAEALTMDMPLPAAFLRFIGGAEVLGGLGLILPAALRIRPELTPLAASGLTVIMAGAVVVTLSLGGGAMAAGPVIVGMLTIYIVRNRRAFAGAVHA